MADEELEEIDFGFRYYDEDGHLRDADGNLRDENDNIVKKENEV